MHETSNGLLIENKSITLQDVWKAKSNISSLIKKSPLVYSPTISKLKDAEIFLKFEQLHESGAFKMRGAVNAIHCLSEAQNPRVSLLFNRKPWLFCCISC